MIKCNQSELMVNSFLPSTVTQLDGETGISDIPSPITNFTETQTAQERDILSVVRLPVNKSI